MRYINKWFKNVYRLSSHINKKKKKEKEKRQFQQFDLSRGEINNKKNNHNNNKIISGN